MEGAPPAAAEGNGTIRVWSVEGTLLADIDPEGHLLTSSDVIGEACVLLESQGLAAMEPRGLTLKTRDGAPVVLIHPNTDVVLHSTKGGGNKAVTVVRSHEGDIDLHVLEEDGDVLEHVCNVFSLFPNDYVLVPSKVRGVDFQLLAKGETDFDCEVHFPGNEQVKVTLKTPNTPLRLDVLKQACKIKGYDPDRYKVGPGYAVQGGVVKAERVDGGNVCTVCFEEDKAEVVVPIGLATQYWQVLSTACYMITPGRVFTDYEMMGTNSLNQFAKGGETIHVKKRVAYQYFILVEMPVTIRKENTREATITCP